MQILVGQLIFVNIFNILFHCYVAFIIYQVFIPLQIIYSSFCWLLNLFLIFSILWFYNNVFGCRFIFIYAALESLDIHLQSKDYVFHHFSKHFSYYFLEYCLSLFFSFETSISHVLEFIILSIVSLHHFFTFSIFVIFSPLFCLVFSDLYSNLQSLSAIFNLFFNLFIEFLNSIINILFV